jgi:transposase-like protein
VPRLRLTLTSERSVERVANNLGIAKSTLSGWRSEHEQSNLQGPHEGQSSTPIDSQGLFFAQLTPPASKVSKLPHFLLRQRHTG